MDFMTSFPYWAILIVILLNALLVQRMNIEIDEGEQNDANGEAPEK